MARGIPAPDNHGASVTPEKRYRFRENCERREVSPSERDVSPDRLEFSSDDTDTEDYTEQEVGERLYTQFLEGRLREENGVDMADGLYRLYPGGRSAHTPPQTANSLTLSSLASIFSRSVGRAEVARRADTVQLSSLTQTNFSALLSELFSGPPDSCVSSERLLVLFFFCSDLALRAMRQGLVRLLQSTSQWTLQFIRGTVQPWAASLRGGWTNILSPGPTRSQPVEENSDNRAQTVDQLAFLGACAAVMLASAVYIRRNW